MADSIRINCYRTDGPGAPGRFQEYEVPLDRETSLQDVLLRIHASLDPTLAFYKHAACTQGLCGECIVRLDGKAVLACTAPVRPGVELHQVEPLRREQVIRDLLCRLGS